MENIDDLRPPESTIRQSNRWTNDEMLLAVEGVRKYGKDFEVREDTPHDIHSGSSGSRSPTPQSKLWFSFEYFIEYFPFIVPLTENCRSYRHQKRGTAAHILHEQSSSLQPGPGLKEVRDR